MRRGMKWTIALSIVVVGLGIAGLNRIPASHSPAPPAKSPSQPVTKVTSAVTTTAADQADTAKIPVVNLDTPPGPAAGEPVAFAEEVKAAAFPEPARTPRGRTAPAIRKPVVRTVAQFPDPLNEVKAVPSSSDDRIPAKGAESGKTVDPNQPIPPYRKSVGAQDASLTVDWVTPESIIVGQKGKFDLVLRNRGRIAISQISIKNALPAGFRLLKAEPAPTQPNAKSPSWIVDRLEPQEESRISLHLVPTKVGNATSHARVDFHVEATSAFRVVEPKLKITADGPESVLVGNQAIFNVTVSNPGSGKTTNVEMKAFLPKGLQAVAKSTVYDLSTLNPGESRSVRVLAKVMALGNHKVTFVTIADGNLRDEVSREVRGLDAHLAVNVKGPNFRYLARPANYTVTVKNTGTAPAHNVTLSCRVPRAFAYLAGGRNGRFDASTKTINWFVGTLEVGKEFSADFKLRAVNRGDFPILAQAVGDRGLIANDKHITRVEGIAAILLEVVDVDDPVEVGAETYYEILVTNQGTEFAKNVVVTASVPDGITLLGSKGPSNGRIVGRKITFAALPKLAPRADAIYRIKVRTDKAGDLRIEAQATADSLKAPVKELESTKVYQD